jgi:hypothetical protein
MSASLTPRPSSADGRPTRQRLDDLEALLQRMLDLPVNKIEDGAPSAAPEAETKPARNEPAVRTLIRPSVPSYAPAEESSLPLAAPPPQVDPVPTEEEGVNVKPNAPADGKPNLPTLSLPDLVSAENKAPVAPSLPPQEAPPAPAGQTNASEEWVPFSSNWRPSSQTWAPLRESWQKARAPEAPATPQPGPVPETNPAVGPPGAPPTKSVPREPGVGATSTRLVLPATLQESVVTEPEEAPEDALPLLTPSVDRPPLAWWAWPFAGINTAFDLAVTPLGPPGRWLRGKRGKDFLGTVGILALAVAAGLVVADWYGWTW